jgi:intraflagellar transport protein 81
LDDQGNAIKDKYIKATQEQEQLSKTLREQQKVIKETHEPNLAQMEMFSDVKKLLQFKLKLHSPYSENPLQIE